MDSRRSNIKAKYSTTCQWLLTHSDYVDWLDPNQADKHHGFLWIRGNPGTGKSTIMSFTCKEMMKRKEMGVISFFFNARGGDLERSTSGMYRSLLFQVLSALPNLIDIFDEPEHKAYLDELCAAILSNQNFEWHVGVLQYLLRSALIRLGQALTIFVDALDECDVDQVEELVEYFEDLGENAVLNGSQLNICFSSRYYPHVDIQYGRKIDLEDQDGHEKDIAMYIRNKLKVGKSKTAEEVKNEIQTKAKGIFMWVVLVVDILKVEYKSGRIFDVKKRLAVLPAKLGDLFKQILLRDQNNLRDLQLCIQWILFSKRPLKLEEYYFAAVAGLNSDELRAWDSDEVTTDDMIRFVVSSSKGLAETTKTKLKTVQFIHESVREFFLEDGLHQLWPNLTTADFESASHAQLQQCCLSYLGVDISSHIRSPLPRAKSDEAKQLRAAVADSFPFLEYAARHVLSHANAAAHSISQRDFLNNFPLNTWVRVSNLFEVHEVRRHTPKVSLLYILAQKNLARLIEEALRLNSMIDVEGERYRYPIFAALANGHRDAVRSLLQTETSRFEDDVLARLDYGYDVSAEKGQTPLEWAAAKGHETVVRSLLEKGRDGVERDLSLSRALSYAAENGYNDIVQLLFAEGCKTESRKSGLHPPLFLAAKNGHIAVVKLLVEKGCNLDAAASSPFAPLLAAVENGYIDIVQLLLERGCDVEARHAHLRRPFLIATENGRSNIMQWLLRKSTSTDIRDLNHMAVLIHAASRGDEALAQLLLEKGAAIEVKDDSSWTPLMTAVASGHEAVVRLLLEKGAAMEAKDNLSWTPLMTAVGSGHEAVVRLLLEKGAAIETKDNLGWTPLMTAVASGYEAVVRLLLDKDADTNAKDNGSLTPLVIAVSLDHAAVVRLLLDKGAATEAKDNKSLTPLMTAVNKGHTAIVRLLLEKGAATEAKDDRSWTPLIMAVNKGRAAIVRLLLRNGADINARNSDGDNALLLAARIRKNGIGRLESLDDATFQLLKSNYQPSVAV